MVTRVLYPPKTNATPQVSAPSTSYLERDILIGMRWTRALAHLDRRHRKGLYDALTKELHHLLIEERSQTGSLASAPRGCSYVGVTYQACTLSNGKPGRKRCEVYDCDGTSQYVCGGCQ